MSTIPPEAKKAMLAVVDAMGSDDYNYYSDFSTTMAASGRSRIIATFRVVVPQVQRQRATANLKKNLENSNYIVSTDSKDTQIDVLIKNTNKKIRINVKPPVGGGYSASKKTAIAESGQAVYAQYVIDNAGVTVDSVIDSQKLKKAYDKCVTTGASFEEIESMDPDWKKSSIMGALKLKTPYGQGYKYLRGGDMVDKVGDVFKKVKKVQGWYGDLNKWSPADIYIAKSGFTAQQLQEELAGITTWETLNARMFELLKDKKFIGVSLKKMERGANLADINFPTDKSTVDFKYEKMESPMTSTSGYLIMKKGPQEIKVNFRTFTSSGGFSGEVLGGSARHGKVGHGAMSNLLKSHGFDQLPDNPTSRRIAVQGDEKMAEWVAKTSKSLGLVNANQEAEAEMRWLQGDTNYRQSKYLTVKLFEIINGINDDKKKNMLMEDMYRYASSTVTGVSGPYVKLS
tara:strand:+ start:2237 stop:3607 length:1371 start_codon:yes stop_codon:yes gene_type:complete